MSRSLRGSPSTLGGSSAPVTATERIVGEFQLGTHEDGLQHRRAFIVADQHVGGAQGEPVHAAGKRNAEMVVAGPAEILDRRRKAGRR